MRADASYRPQHAPATGFRRYAIGALTAMLLASAILATAPDPTAAELAARRERIASLDPARQQDLLRKLERFSALPPEEQDRLRDLQAAITADPQSDRLLELLERYHEWLKTITPSQRARLAELPAKERVHEIERIVRSQRDAQRLEPLTSQDMREIRRWVEKLIERHRDELVASLPSRYRTWYDRQTDDGSKQMTLMFPLFGQSRHEQVESKVTAEDIDQLHSKLSESAKAELHKATTLEEKRKLVGGWLFSSMRRSWSWGQRGRRSNPVLTEELLQYLQNDVPPADRQRLLKMPRDEMLQELRKQYFERAFGERSERRPSFERRERGKRDGPGSEKKFPTPNP